VGLPLTRVKVQKEEWLKGKRVVMES